MALHRVPERSRASFRATFVAENDQVFTPTAVRYRVDSQDGTVLVDWTSLTPASSITITVAASANRILNDANAAEVKIITIQSDYGTDNQMSEELQYQVVNLVGFTS